LGSSVSFVCCEALTQFRAASSSWLVNCRCARFNTSAPAVLALGSCGAGVGAGTEVEGAVGGARMLDASLLRRMRQLRISRC
jgi:hypothetical protein